MRVSLCVLLFVLFVGCRGGEPGHGSDPVGSGSGPREPPTSEKAHRIESLVNNASALVEHEGKAAAFAKLRVRGSEWFDGETYVFVYDMDLNVLLNPAFPKREGTNMHGQHDANGKPMHDEFAHVVKTKGSGWVDYVFPKPGTSTPVLKWSYVKAVNVDGAPGIIGAGFYPE